MLTAEELGARLADARLRQFTGFTSIKVQILTQKTRLAANRPPAADGAPANPTSSPASDVDALEFLEAVDVLAKLPKDFNDAVLTLPKWTEKKEVGPSLSTLLALLVPKYKY
jgi:hypothetical protein